MSSLNQATLIGTLGRDPELRDINGDPVCNLSLATNERWRDKNSGELREKTEWHRVTLWGPKAEIADRFLRKGSKVMIQGQLETRKWVDQAGVEKYSTEIVVRAFRGEMVLLDKPPQRDDDYGQSGPQQELSMTQRPQERYQRPAEGRQDAGTPPSRYNAPLAQRPPVEAAPSTLGPARSGHNDLDDEIPF